MNRFQNACLILFVLMASASVRGDAELVLVRPSEDQCVKPGDALTVELWMRDLGANEAIGFQATLTFDPSLLALQDGQYTSAPFGQHFIDPITPDGASIELSAGIDFLGGQTPTSNDALLVTLTFAALSNEGTTSVDFDPTSEPPNRITQESGADITPLLLTNSEAILVDGAAPVIVECIPTENLNCYSAITPPAADRAEFEAAGGVVTDNLDPDVTVTMIDEQVIGADCPRVILRTYEARDCAGNTSTCEQTLNVGQAGKLILIRSDESERVKIGETVTVELWMRELDGQQADGFQAFLTFDPTDLQLETAEYATEPFGFPLINPIQVVGPDIDLAAGIDPLNGQTPESADSHLATFTFTAPSSEGSTSVDFRPHDPPTRLTHFTRDLLPLILNPTEGILIDDTPPIITTPTLIIFTPINDSTSYSTQFPCPWVFK